MKPKTKTTIQFQGQHFTCHMGETALDTLLRHQQPIPWSCRAGICHSCLMQVTEGEIPEEAQHGLTPTQKTNGLLLVCQCYPQEGTLGLQTFKCTQQPIPAVIVQMHKLTPTLLKLTLSPRSPITYRPGQYLTIGREKNDAGDRYTLVSCPWNEADLHIHIARKAGHALSSWLFDEATAGTQIWLQGLNGQCCFAPERSTPLIICGVDHGIGAALAVANDALWHDANLPVKVALLGEWTGKDLDLPKGSVYLLNDTDDLIKQVKKWLRERRFQSAQWLAFGSCKSVETFSQFLLQQGVSPDAICIQSYR